MTKLEELNRKMLDIEKRGLLSEEQYAAYKQLLVAVEALKVCEGHSNELFQETGEEEYMLASDHARDVLSKLESNSS